MWTSMVAMPIAAAPGTGTADVSTAPESVGHHDGSDPAGNHGALDPAEQHPGSDTVTTPTADVPDVIGDGWASSSGERDDEWVGGSDGDPGDLTGEISASDTLTGSQADTIRLRNDLRQVEQSGQFGVTTRATIPDRVTSFEVTLPEAATNVDARGFSRSSDGTWRWDGATRNPELTYRMPANRTVDRDDPIAGPGNYIFVDAGEWALVQPPSVGAGWSWTGGGQVRLVRENTASEGAASRAMAYLGPYEEHTHREHGQTFRFVVPAAANLEEPPEDILAELAYASGALQVGDRDPEVFIVAAPTGDVQWGVRGLQTGPADMWVRDVERLDTADNVWTHEYVHTRQGYQADTSLRWFTEATATYYAALLTLERGGTSFDDFRRVLRLGEREPQGSSILAEPATWRNHADYTKGALVAGEIDRRIRLATGGEATLATVFRELNAQDDSVDNDDFLRSVRDAGGSEVREEARRLTTTRENTGSWDRSTHDTAFGTLPARIGFSIAGDDAVRVSGDYRERAIAPDRRDPINLVTGETLSVDVTATNTGGTTGEYDLSLVVDGETLDARSGRLPAGETVVEEFEHTVHEPGTYDVDVDGQRLTVVVSEPTPLTLVDLSVDRSEVGAGDSVTVTARVVNEDVIPGREEFTVTLDGRAVATETVHLDAESETTFETTVTLEEPGESTIAIGDERVTVQVAEPPTRDSVPGFGPAPAIVALALLTLGVRQFRDGKSL